MKKDKNVSYEFLNSLPKVLLHDHLDGGLRPQTIIELAKDIGYRKLPTRNSNDLQQWFFRGANRGSLALFLEGFQHTCAVMQTEEALERVAYECVEDMYKDGVIYFETRFCPALHTQKGLHWEQVLKAVLSGLEKGKQKFKVEFGVIIAALRNQKISLPMAELAVDFRDRGVVGFDIAGEEGGFPPKDHIDAFHYIQRENFNITIHAGEAFGKESIWQAIQWCGAHRIGHATRLIDDIVVDADGKILKFGNLSQYVLDKRIPLELCLSSNLHTGAIDKIENHPFKIFRAGNFRISLNTDDRLMSNTNLTKEFQIAHKVFDATLEDFEKITINSMKSAFINFHKRIDIIYATIKPGYKKAKNILYPYTRKKIQHENPIQ